MHSSHSASRPDDESDFARSNRGFSRGPQSAGPGYAQDVSATENSGFGRGPSERKPAADPDADRNSTVDADNQQPLQPGDAGYYAFPETEQGAREAREGCPIEKPGSRDRLAEDPE